jgi:hypothetical protein
MTRHLALGFGLFLVVTPSAADPEPTSGQIMERVGKAYAACKTYRDNHEDRCRNDPGRAATGTGIGFA